MDVSGSMCSTDIDPTRIEAAEKAAIEFVTSQASGSEIGLVAFSGLAAVIQPPTTDQQALVDAIKSLTTGRRTAIGSGILAAIDAIAEVDPNVARSVIPGRPGVEPDPVVKGAYVPDIIVLLTDGANNAGPAPLDAAQQAVDRGVRVYTIGFGIGRRRRARAELPPAVHRQRAARRGGFGGGRRVRRRGRRVPPRHRRGHAARRGRRHRRQVLPGRERQRARGRVQRPADYHDHEGGAGRGQRRVRRPRRAPGGASRCSSAAPGGRSPSVDLGGARRLRSSRLRGDPLAITGSERFGSKASRRRPSACSSSLPAIESARRAPADRSRPKAFAGSDDLEDRRRPRRGDSAARRRQRRLRRCVADLAQRRLDPAVQASPWPGSTHAASSPSSAAERRQRRRRDRA